MCQNNLREGAFAAYAVDPNNPHSPEGGLYVADGGDPSALGLLLPAVQRVIDVGDLGASVLPMEQIRSATDHGFDLMA
jgi:hypothetical protein